MDAQTVNDIQTARLVLQFTATVMAIMGSVITFFLIALYKEVKLSTRKVTAIEKQLAVIKYALAVRSGNGRGKNIYMGDDERAEV
jgi:hypothetical protein